MSVNAVTSQLDNVAINNEDMMMNSPPAKLMKKSVDATVRPVQPLADRQNNVVTFDPALASTVNKPVAPATFGAIETGKTPKKTVKRALEKGVPVPIEVINRWDSCTGIPLRVSKFAKDGSRISRACCMCKAGTTSWYCIGCKAWFCMSGNKDTETRQKRFVCTTVKKGEEEFVFEMSCFHQKHQAAWEKQEGKERLEATVQKIHECAADLEKIKETYGL